MKILLTALLMVLITACQKEPQLPKPSQMYYVDLNDTQIGYPGSERFDLDGNGTFDIGFRTLGIGDPLLQMDKYQYCAVSMIESNFPINKNDDVDIRQKGDLIQTENTPDYEWFRVSVAVLAQKNVGMVDPPFWTGVWKDVQKQYLPIQIMKNEKRYNGWVQISFDRVAERLIVHRSGISTVPDVDIQAGF